MGMQSIKDRAFFLSNDLLGAYDRVSVWGQNVRERYIPFWSWKEVNMRRYLQIMKNAFNDKGIWQGVGKNLVRSAAIKSPYYIVRGGSLALSLTMFQIMIAMWNSWAFGDEEDDLPEDIRKRTHILLPSLDALARGEWTSKDSEGKTQYFSRVGALADLLEWFGLDAAKQDAQDLMTGRMPIEEKLKDFYRSPINVVVQGLHPAWKVGGELAMRQAMFPEWHKPRVIRDRVLHTMRSIGLENEYIAFMDTFVRPTPSRGYLKSVKNVFVYESDPFEAAYYDTYANKRRFQKKMGKFGEGYWLTPKGSALYSARTALRYGDEDAMVYYMNEYFKMGGTKKGLLRSLDNLNPLAGIAKKDRAAFVASLSPEDLDKLVKAMVFYVQLRTGHKASELFKLIDEEKDRRKPKPIRPPFESIGKLGEIAKIKPLTKREAKGGK
jgi:hypothetical protein